MSLPETLVIVIAVSCASIEIASSQSVGSVSKGAKLDSEAVRPSVLSGSGWRDSSSSCADAPLGSVLRSNS